MKTLYQVVLTPEPEGGYTATVPVLPGCVSYGKTLDEARVMITDAIEGYLHSMRKHKEPAPTIGYASILASVAV
ncbi:MAG: type II toxin-antitoxin system HicB family antitoxin [Patescibacteria group bacterium]